MQKEKIIGKGAEAVLTKVGSLVIKSRIEKNYRHPELDKKLRKLRTRTEARILNKAINMIKVPKVISSDEIKAQIQMRYIEGKKLSENLEKTNYKKVCEKIGKSIAKLHDNSIIHGDLTTSNMIYNVKENEVYLIDFGLSFQSIRTEDKAVDLHLIKQALEAKHPSIHEEAYKSVIKAYAKQSKKASETLKQLEKVEKRGRYKAQY